MENHVKIHYFSWNETITLSYARYHNLYKPDEKDTFWVYKSKNKNFKENTQKRIKIENADILLFGYKSPLPMESPYFPDHNVSPTLVIMKENIEEGEGSVLVLVT